MLAKSYFCIVIWDHINIWTSSLIIHRLIWKDFRKLPLTLNHMIFIWMPLCRLVVVSYICFYQCGFSIIWKFKRFNQNLHKQLQVKQADFPHSKLQASFEEIAAAHWKVCWNETSIIQIKFQKILQTSCWLSNNLNTVCDVPFSVSLVVKCLFIYKIKAIHCAELFPCVPL